MESAPSLVQLVKDISARFPIDAQLIAARIEELGYEPDAFTAWFEQFSQRTTEAIRNGDETSARGHLALMSQRMETADKIVTEYIDVYYVESLMWNLDDKKKKWGWSLIPNNLRKLYVAMWGEPSF